MPAGKLITEDIQWIIVCMGATMSAKCIAMYTDMGERKVRDILAHLKQLGDARGTHDNNMLHWVEIFQ